jgi:hypothetical protein
MLAPSPGLEPSPRRPKRSLWAELVAGACGPPGDRRLGCDRGRDRLRTYAAVGKPIKKPAGESAGNLMLGSALAAPANPGPFLSQGEASHATVTHRPTAVPNRLRLIVFGYRCAPCCSPYSLGALKTETHLWGDLGWVFLMRAVVSGSRSGPQKWALPIGLDSALSLSG